MLTLLLSSAMPAWAQGRYGRAVADEKRGLIITTADNRTIVLSNDDPGDGFRQVGFRDVRISRDGTTVAWVEMFENCCTSDPVGARLARFHEGARQVLSSGPLVIGAWAFHDDDTKIALRREPLHGEQHLYYQLFETASGQMIAEHYVPPDAVTSDLPGWVLAVTPSRLGSPR